MEPPSIRAPHTPPRWPWAWSFALLASQLLALTVWMRWGWHAGLAVFAASHLAMIWGSLRPDSQLFGPALRRLDTGERVVWLTIDDGPSAETLPILDLLDAHGARATFFVVGDRVRQHPELAREMVRRGHQLANHSDSHPTKWFWALGPRRMRQEIDAAQATLTEIAGAPPVWFRAVVGMANPFVSAPLKRLGLARVAWTVRGFDGLAGDVRSVVARIERGLRPGAIVLMHEGAPHGNNVEMMALLLQRFDALGYRCVLPTADVAQPTQLPGAGALGTR